MSIFYIDSSNTEQISDTIAYSKDYIGVDILSTTSSNINYKNTVYGYQNPITQPTKVSFLGITNDSFTINDTGNGFSFGTSLVVRPNPLPEAHDGTSVALYLKLNNNTISNLDILQANEITQNTLYVLLEGGGDQEEFGLISFDVDNDYTLINPQIINSGSFVSSSFSDDTQNNFSDSANNDNIGNNNFTTFGSTKTWLSSINDIRVIADNSRIPLNSVLKIKRRLSALDNIFTNPTDEADLTPNFTINNSTINISGGVNYRINDTFTVHGGSTNGKVTVTSVDSVTGAIIETDISSRGSLFTNYATVTYDNNTGSGADIVIADNYSVSNITVNHGGNGYSSSDTIVFYDPSDLNTPLDYEINFYPFVSIFTDVIGAEPILNNDYSLDKIIVQNSGYLHQEEPLLELVNLSTNEKINNIYITSNKNNFITTEEVE